MDEKIKGYEELVYLQVTKIKELRVRVSELE